MKIYKQYKKVIKETLREYDEDYDDFDDFEEKSYFQSKLPMATKKMNNKFVGRNVTWYGTPGKMIYIHKDYVNGMFGNIYDSEKLEYVTELIFKAPENVEFECSYGLLHEVEFINIKEEQESMATGNFETDYDGHSAPSTIGDEELDKYIGNEHIDDTQLSDWIWYDEDLHNFLNDNKFFLVYGKSMEAFKEELSHINVDWTEDDKQYLEEFIDLEERLKQAVDNNSGDLGTLQLQLRDGHHRVMGAIDAGEEYICVDIPEEEVTRYGNLIEDLRYIGFVTQKGP